jgi:hypothetical protein
MSGLTAGRRFRVAAKGLEPFERFLKDIFGKEKKSRRGTTSKIQRKT